jgi:hypothetical protein
MSSAAVDAMPAPELVRHDIAVSNVLYGGANFMTLRLPETWDIAPGVGRPEIVAVHDRGGRKWIASGQAWYVLYHRELGWAMELMLESSALKRRLGPPDSGETLDIHSHRARVRRWQRKRGLFRPKMITFVEVGFNCEQSERYMRYELSGRCPPEGFEQMLGFMREWWCH